MARFLVIHSTPPEMTQDQAIEGARKVATRLATGVEWLNSWWIAEGVHRLFCEWEAPDADSVRASLEPVKNLLPIESLYEVEWIDPQWYTQRL